MRLSTRSGAWLSADLLPYCRFNRILGLYCAEMDVSAQQCLAINKRIFHPFRKELARFQTTRELEQSNLYRQLKPDIEDVLERVLQEQFADASKAVSLERPI